MIFLISIWELKAGCPEELAFTLQHLAEEIRETEKDTLAYNVSLTGPDVLDADNNPIEPPPQPIPLQEQTQVTFIEAYKDEAAFSQHVNGVPFQTFLKNNLHYFKTSPDNPDWPLTHNTMLDRQSGFARKEFSHLQTG